MNTAHNVCNALRSGNLSHNDIGVVLACLATSLQYSDLSDYSSKVVIDLLDEIIGQVEDDCIQQEQMSSQADVPGFDGTHASLDALTIRVVA